MKHLLIGFIFAAGAAGAAEPRSFQSAAMNPPLPHPALYSFVDVYRLTVAGAMAGLPLAENATDAPIRVAVAQGPGAEPRFSVASAPQPDKWLLLLAGLALAGWVAHRRLVHSI
jgi:MYXO-CTERM domain-containing protein